jgi:AcrR family transcriptional regulator
MAETKPSETQTQDQTPRQARADRILDVAGDLMLRYGYKRVTVDDVADEAGIGKGTIYQHWPTRQALFGAAILREFADAVDELLETVRQDPQAALLHRLLSNMYLTIMRRPLLRAVYGADLDTLGKMAENDFARLIDVEENSIFRTYIQLLAEHGLIRRDLDSEELFFSFIAILTGYFTFETFNPGMFDLPVERKAEIVADAIRRLFETDTPPLPEAVQAIAGRTIELLAGLAEVYRSALRSGYE